MNQTIRKLVVCLSFVMAMISTAQGATPKFRPATPFDPVIGSYLVTLDSSVPDDAAQLVAGSLAHTYVGQLERSASSDRRTFTLTMLPSRARTLSADPRVREVSEIAQPDSRETPPVAPRSASLASPHLVPHQLSSSGTYTYDGSGNIKGIGVDTFLYDPEGRLVDATVQSNEQRYEYDIYGNRTNAYRVGSAIACLGNTTCEAPVTMSEAPSTTNHLAGVTYDEAGNVTQGYDATYVYDGTGMITKATVGTDVRNFVYTADDERIAVKQGASWTWMVRDHGGQILREFTSLETSNPFALSGHAWTKDYVWRDGLLLASTSIPAGYSTPVTYHYHLDHLGTPRMITRDGGIVVSTHNYYPFGSEMDVTPQESPAEAMKFTGHERDFIAGSNHSVDYMHARYYNGSLGRFLSVDRHYGELVRPQSWNRYAYASNNPISRIDPDGYADFYVTTTFPRGDFHDDRVTNYLSANAANFDISNGSATTKNFQKGLNDPEGVSIYFGHSNTTDSLLFNKAGFVPFSNFSNHNAVTCIAACNSAAIIRDAKIGPGQALIGVTSNLKAGFVKAGDLSYVSTQLIAGLKAGKTVGQIVNELNKFYADRAKKDPNYKVKLMIKGDSDIVVK